MIIGDAGADEITTAGNMWRVGAFKRWLARAHGSDAAWDSRIVPAMRAAAAATLKCCQASVKARAGSCQIYGFDFIVDVALGVWLLEVSSSPTMEYSTAVTADLCAAVQEDTLKARVCVRRAGLVASQQLAHHGACCWVAADLGLLCQPVGRQLSIQAAASAVD
jgi:Tubulin-tyrosine ligase family